MPFRTVGGIGPEVEYAPTVQAPVLGRTLPALSEPSGAIDPVDIDMRFVPALIRGEPDCGTPLPFIFSEALYFELASPLMQLCHDANWVGLSKLLRQTNALLPPLPYWL